MPILDVEMVIRPDETLSEGLAADIAGRAGLALGAAPGRTWIRLHTLEVDHYAEDAAGRADAYPVFASILHRQRPRGDTLRREVTRLTEAIAAACNRPPENVHLIYEADAAGRVAFGGVLVE